MKLADLVRKVMPNFNIKVDKEQKRLEQGVVAVQNVYEKSESQKEANEKAMNIVIDTIQTHPEMPVGEFLKMVQEKTALSDNSLVEIIKQMPDIKSEKATVEAVKKVDLASDAITEIIQEAPVSPVTAQKLAEQIPDEEVQKEQQAEIERKVREEQIKREQDKEKNIISKLDEIYDNCEGINDAILVGDISKLNIERKTEKISERLKQIVAKKVAIDCMKFGGPKLPTLMKIMPATEMLEEDLPALVETEYQKAKAEYEEDEKEYYRYNAERKKTANIISKKFNANGLNTRVEAVPFETYAQRIADGEYDTFIGGVELSGNMDLTSLLMSSSTPENNGSNYFGYADANMDRLIGIASSSADIDSYKTAINELNKYCSSQLPLLGICFRSEALVTNNVTGLKTPSDGNVYGNMYQWTMK